MHVAVVGVGRAVGEDAEQPGDLGGRAAAVAAQVQDEPVQLGALGQVRYRLQHLVCRAGEEPGQLHVGDVSFQELRGYRRRRGDHFLVHGGERGPVPVAVAVQRWHRGVWLVHPEPVKLLGEPGERGDQQHPVIQHRPGVVVGEHAVVGLLDGGDRGWLQRRRDRRRR